MTPNKTETLPKSFIDAFVGKQHESLIWQYLPSEMLICIAPQITQIHQKIILEVITSRLRRVQLKTLLEPFQKPSQEPLQTDPGRVQKPTDIGRFCFPAKSCQKTSHKTAQTAPRGVKQILRK